jgi:HAMP domain-containing protein
MPGRNGELKMANKKRKLKNLLMNQGIQVPVLLLVILAGFLFSNAILFYSFVRGNYEIFFNSYPEASQDFIDLKYNDLLNFGWILIAVSTLTTIILAVYALIVSHRTAGAGYRIKAVVDEIKSGKTGSRIHLRKNDELQELAQSINELMDQKNEMTASLS